MRRPLRFAIVVVLSLSAAACASGGSGAPGRVTITLYNGQHVETTDTLVAAFEKATGIEVAVRSNDEDIFDDEIVAEGARSPADVVFTENSPALEYLQKKGLLSPVDHTTLARTPSRFNSPQGDWVGVSARVSVLIYNPSLIRKSALPAHVLELADPRYKGELAFAAGETDFQPIVTSVLRTYGKAETLKWLDGIKQNAGSHLYPDNETISTAVNRGIVAFGVVNQYYWYRMRAEIGAAKIHSEIVYFAPRDPGYVLDVSGAGILRSSRHKGAAQRFLAFLVSKQGQEIIARSISFEYPIASGVQTTQPETPFKDLKPNPIGIAELGTGSRAIALLREVQLL
ncbi:MAG: extracellular solute-binding protein [Acidimicrobiales bacterium]|jgi:iron(III) transport system substrate-binding protein